MSAQLNEADWNAIDGALPPNMRESWLLTTEGERLIDAVEQIVANHIAADWAWRCDVHPTEPKACYRCL